MIYVYVVLCLKHCDSNKNGGFLKWGYPQSSSILDWDFPENHTAIAGARAATAAIRRSWATSNRTEVSAKTWDNHWGYPNSWIVYTGKSEQKYDG